MGLLMNHRNEAITLWRQAGQDVFNKATYDSPVTFQGRYQESENVYMDEMGRELVSNTAIFVELELKVGDWVALGTHADTSPVATARQIKRVNQLRFVSQSADVYKGLLD
ncbi:MAG: hypothetical protein Unbinned8472contig1000_9 [Prokaryotic dsDNA virus sp.]|nr:MAG: hypothetical protein Unbinned8472contig1000_9 [Prokaryotic dsDNA virus sp.]|tara:strand:+ start:15331 stop:15660 length:330 start_codon:yes stop_codon:yes gene_type:complete